MISLTRFVRQQMRGRRPRGMTLLELLVVISIVGILVALLLPAVQAAREASRAAMCKNHLRQQALGTIMHLETLKFFPTGGWGWDWSGDSDRGFGLDQPGGWIFNTLPFIEEQDLHDAASDGDPGVITAVQKSRAAVLCQTPVSIFSCPTRRAPEPLPNPLGTTSWNVDPTSQVARSDYAINEGDYFPPNGMDYMGPPSLNVANYPWQDISGYTGISYYRSRVRLVQLRDGTSRTLLIGEKCLNPAEYYTGTNLGDARSMYCGSSLDIGRAAVYAGPIPDSNWNNSWNEFGSAHPSGCQFALCDGSVRSIQFEISFDVFRSLSSRNDGRLVESDDY